MTETASCGIPKWSVIFRFWSTPQEIEVTDLVLCQDRETKAFHYKFLDTQGRLWDNVPESDIIRVKNFPDQYDIEDFQRLLRDSEYLKLNGSLKQKAPVDVNIM